MFFQFFSEQQPKRLLLSKMCTFQNSFEKVVIFLGKLTVVNHIVSKRKTIFTNRYDTQRRIKGFLAYLRDRLVSFFHSQNITKFCRPTIFMKNRSIILDQNILTGALQVLTLGSIFCQPGPCLHINPYLHKFFWWILASS